MKRSLSVLLLFGLSSIGSMAATLDVCSRTLQVTRAIEIQTGKKCDEVKPEDLLKIGDLDLVAQGITSLRETDFVGLDNLKWLLLGSNRLEELPENIFRPLKRLQILELNNNALKFLPDKLLSTNLELEWLYIGENRLEHFPEGLLEDKPNLTNLGLERNFFGRLPDHTLAGLNRLDSLSYDLDNFSTSALDQVKGLSAIGVVVKDAALLAEDYFWHFPKLEHLTILLGDKILPHRLHKGLLKNTPTLEFFCIKGIEPLRLQLEPLDRDFFQSLPNIKQIMLWKLGLTSVTPGLFRNVFSKAQPDRWTGHWLSFWKNPIGEDEANRLAEEAYPLTNLEF